MYIYYIDEMLEEIKGGYRLVNGDYQVQQGIDSSYGANQLSGVGPANQAQTTSQNQWVG